MTTPKEKAPDACNIVGLTRQNSVQPDFSEKSHAAPTDLQRIADALEVQNQLLAAIGKGLIDQLSQLTREVRGVSSAVSISGNDY